MITKQKAINIFEEILRDLSSLGSIFFHFLIIILLIPFFDTSFELIKLIVLNLLLSSLICYTIRLLYFTDRPVKRTFKTLLEKLDASSFPSAHVCRSFGLTVLSYQFENIYLIILLSFISLGISYSRIYFDCHHKRDVIFGAIIGVSIGYLILLFA